MLTARYSKSNSEWVFPGETEGPFLATSLNHQHPNCKCAKGELHGPYYYRFFYRGGRQRKKYVKKGEVSATFAACLAYKRNKEETRELIRQINETGNRMLKALGMMIKSWS